MFPFHRSFVTSFPWVSVSFWTSGEQCGNFADIQFWKNRKSMEGLSVRSVFFNVFQSVIVVLYVMDNETNFVVRVSVFIGLAIEVWKIFKVLDFKVRLWQFQFIVLKHNWNSGGVPVLCRQLQHFFLLQLDRENKLFGVIPKPTFEDKSTYTESNTKQYDMVGSIFHSSVSAASLLPAVASVAARSSSSSFCFSLRSSTCRGSCFRC